MVMLLVDLGFGVGEVVLVGVEEENEELEGEDEELDGEECGVGLDEGGKEHGESSEVVEVVAERVVGVGWVGEEGELEEVRGELEDLEGGVGVEEVKVGVHERRECLGGGELECLLESLHYYLIDMRA